MGDGDKGGEIEILENGANREGVLEPFADDEIGAVRAGPETDGMAVKLPEDPFRALDFGQTAGGRVKTGSCASGDLAPMFGDLREQGRGPLRRIGVALALPQEDPRVIAQGRTEARDAAPL